MFQVCLTVFTRWTCFLSMGRDWFTAVLHCPLLDTQPKNMKRWWRWRNQNVTISWPTWRHSWWARLVLKISSGPGVLLTSGGFWWFSSWKAWGSLVEMRSCSGLSWRLSLCGFLLWTGPRTRRHSSRSSRCCWSNHPDRRHDTGSVLSK